MLPMWLEETDLYLGECARWNNRITNEKKVQTYFLMAIVKSSVKT